MARSLAWFLNAASQPAETPTDAELLRRFTAAGDSAAFELLVRRHAAGVWAACRGVLRNDADADDAFQAAFLTLARHAGAVRAGTSLGGWLHRVAVNSALKLRAKRRPFAPLPDELADRSTDSDDTAAVLHEELARLPAAYRAAVVAVDLEGHSHADAAKLLGWPVGTVSGRVARGREELRRRLERRGVTAPAVVVAVVSGTSVQSAIAVAVGATVASAVVASLSTEVWAMILTARRKFAAVVAGGLLGLAVFGGVGVVAVAQPPKPADSAKPPPAEERKPVEKLEDLPKVEVTNDDTPELKLAKEILLAELERYRIIELRINSGQFQGGSSYLQLNDMLHNLTAAAGDVFDEPKDQLPWFEFRLSVAKKWEKFNGPRVEQGVEEPQLLLQLRAERARAELALLKLKKQIK